MSTEPLLYSALTILIANLCLLLILMRRARK